MNSIDTIAKCQAGCGRYVNVDIVGPICGWCGKTKSPIAKCKAGCGRDINMLVVGTICGYCAPRPQCKICGANVSTTSHGFCASCYSNQMWHRHHGLPGAFSLGN